MELSGKSRAELAILFPWIDFSYLQSDTDLIGPATVSTEENVREMNCTLEIVF